MKSLHELALNYRSAVSHEEICIAWRELEERDKKLVDALKDIYNQAGEVHNPVVIAKWALKEIGEME